MQHTSLHSFHIPVLGLSFSIDTPLKVARFGISSVVSIVDDELVEDMRRHHCTQNQMPYTPISGQSTDYRAERITAYLNMMQDLLTTQMATLQSTPITEGSESYQYFEMLPPQHVLAAQFNEYLAEESPQAKQALQQQLLQSIEPGRIDVNIMAKVDNTGYNKDGEKLPDEYSDALSALRGFAKSKLQSSIIFSAGYNPRLYSYAETFDCFYPQKNNEPLKKIILKVSDYRSALVQGKILAKKGLWISEFRIESGLNCGGHAFATEGLLLGPILEEFKQNRPQMHAELLALCNDALMAKGKERYIDAPTQKITVQGGIGTAAEQQFLLSYYQLDGTGWGSPFLLVPEATNVEAPTLQLMAQAKKEDYYLSHASPLGVPINNIKNSSSQAQLQQRIQKGRPGSPCYKKYLASNTEFTDKPICTASRQYQNLKIKQLQQQQLPPAELQQQISKVLEKDCLCEGLTASVKLKNNMPLQHKLSAVAICPGPNLAYFSGTFSLKEMVSHIYGRINLNNALERPHVFINELQLYVDYFKNQLKESSSLVNEKQKKYFDRFKNNLQCGIEYYKTLLPSFANLNLNTLQLKKLELQLATLAC